MKPTNASLYSIFVVQVVTFLSVPGLPHLIMKLIMDRHNEYLD
jgi:hypothetical protein